MSEPKGLWGFDIEHPFLERLKLFRPDGVAADLPELYSRPDLDLVLSKPQEGVVLEGLKMEAAASLAEESCFLDGWEVLEKKKVPTSFLAKHGAIALNAKFPGLDPERAAFLTVGSPWVWGVVRVLVAAGFKEVVLLIQDHEQEQAISECSRLIRHYQQKFFDLHFEVLPNSKLVLQRPRGSLLFNVLSQEQMDEGMGNLHFLNFLGKGALVINHEISAELGLLQEAHELGLSLLSFEDFYFDVLARVL